MAPIFNNAILFVSDNQRKNKQMLLVIVENSGIVVRQRVFFPDVVAGRLIIL